MRGNLLPKTLDFGDSRADIERAASLANSEAAEAAVADLNSSSVTVTENGQEQLLSSFPGCLFSYPPQTQRRRRLLLTACALSEVSTSQNIAEV